MANEYIKRLRIAAASLFAPKGLTGPHITAGEWDDQFSGDKWAYLSTTNQREHYDCIINLYHKHGNNGTILDIGCGEGLLYKYLDEHPPIHYDQYTGIDISAVAVKHAASHYPGARFETINYEHEHINEKFDVVIFNETLYYFNNPLDTLQKCLSENLQFDGKLIISMCDHERHDMIWQHVEKQYIPIESVRVSNEENIAWTIKIFEAKK